MDSWGLNDLNADVAGTADGGTSDYGGDDDGGDEGSSGKKCFVVMVIVLSVF